MPLDLAGIVGGKPLVFSFKSLVSNGSVSVNGRFPIFLGCVEIIHRRGHIRGLFQPREHW